MQSAAFLIINIYCTNDWSKQHKSKQILKMTRPINIALSMVALTSLNSISSRFCPILPDFKNNQLCFKHCAMLWVSLTSTVTINTHCTTIIRYSGPAQSSELLLVYYITCVCVVCATSHHETTHTKGAANTATLSMRPCVTSNTFTV